jgi:hypothetical protein
MKLATSNARAETVAEKRCSIGIQEQATNGRIRRQGSNHTTSRVVMGSDNNYGLVHA